MSSSRLFEIEQRHAGESLHVTLPTQLKLPVILRELRDLRNAPPKKRTLRDAWRASFLRRKKR